MECVELAPAFEPRHTSDSGSKLHALHTLRETRPPLSSVCAICSVSPENLRKKTRFSPILCSAPHTYEFAARRAEDRRALPAAKRLPMKTTSPRILTTTVGSYPVPDWLAALPSEQSLLDATRVIFNIQRQAGIDLPTDGELYRFDINHPDTNGMIDYFVRPLAGVSTKVGASSWRDFSARETM